MPGVEDQERKDITLFSQSSDITRVRQRSSVAVDNTTCLLARLRLRERLSRYNSIEDAVSLIQGSRRIIILTGAGISYATLFRVIFTY